MNVPVVGTDYIEQRRGKSGAGTFLTQPSKWVILLFIKARKTGGGDRFGLKIIFKELYLNAKNQGIICF